MSSQSKISVDKIKGRSVPLNFHVSGHPTEGTLTYYGGFGTDNVFRIATSDDALARKTILLSLQIKFKSSEPNKFFRLSVSENESGETNILEIKRQTRILRGGLDDKYEAGTTYTQFWGIPLHLLFQGADRYFYLNVHFDTTPLGQDDGTFGIQEFLIRGLTDVGADYEYKGIK